jgi:hypothetical protein
MTTPMALSAHPLLHAFGWTLVHFCWQGALAAGVLGCTLALVRQRSSQARYAACCSALLLMAAMPVLTFARIASDDLRAAHDPAEASPVVGPAMLLEVGAGDPIAPLLLRRQWPSTTQCPGCSRHGWPARSSSRSGSTSA